MIEAILTAVIIVTVIGILCAVMLVIAARTSKAVFRLFSLWQM